MQNPGASSDLSLGLRPLLVAVLLLGWPTALRAAEATGTDFWFAFPENDAPGQLSLRILGESGTGGTVEIPGLAFSAPFDVPTSGLVTVSLPASAMLSTADGVEDLGVHVTADRPIVVYGVSLEAGSSDTFLALPTGSLGADYFVLSYAPEPLLANARSQVAVVATGPATTVSITPTAAIGAHPPGGSYVVILNAGEAYQGQSGGDLSGTRILADQPIALLSGNPATYVPAGQADADHLVELLPPASALGLEAFVVHSAVRTQDERYRILATTDNTAVTVSTGGVFNLSEGQWVEAPFSSATGFQANHPVLVTRFATGGSIDAGSGDPFMVAELPVDRFAHGYHLATADDGTHFPSNFVHLVVPAPAVGRVALDGARIPSGDFTAIGSTGFSFSRQAIAPGAHRVVGPLPFGSEVYGFGSLVGYASPAGGASLPFLDGFEEGDALAWTSSFP